MSNDADGELLRRARDAASRGDVPRAFDLFMEADADRPLGLPDLRHSWLTSPMGPVIST